MLTDQEELAKGVSAFSVEVSNHSYLIFSKLKQYQEVVFWERPEVPSIEPSDRDFEITLEAGDRIDLAAYVAYRDPLLWWVVALANDVWLPPLGMNPGNSFRIPDGGKVLDLIRTGTNRL